MNNKSYHRNDSPSVNADALQIHAGPFMAELRGELCRTNARHQTNSARTVFEVAKPGYEPSTRRDRVGD